MVTNTIRNKDNKPITLIKNHMRLKEGVSLETISPELLKPIDIADSVYIALTGKDAIIVRSSNDKVYLRTSGLLPKQEAGILVELGRLLNDKYGVYLNVDNICIEYKKK